MQLLPGGVYVWASHNAENLQECINSFNGVNSVFLTPILVAEVDIPRGITSSEGGIQVVVDRPRLISLSISVN